MQRNAVEIESVWPSQRSQLDKDLFEKGLVPQRLDHWPALADDARKIILALHAVRKTKSQALTAERLDLYHFDDFDHVIHPDRQSAGKVRGDVRAANSP